MTHNRCHATYREFAEEALEFLRKTVPSRWQEFRGSVTDNFPIIDPKEFHILGSTGYRSLVMFYWADHLEIVMKKKRVLLTCRGTFGEIIPIWRLAKQLARHGKTVYVCGPAYSEPRFKEIAASFYIIPSTHQHPNDIEKCFSARSGFEAVFEKIDHYASEDFNHFCSVIAKENIDEVIHSWISPSAALAAHRAGVAASRVYLYPFALNQNADPPTMPRYPRLTSSSQPLAKRQASRLLISSHYRRLLPRLNEIGNTIGLPPENYDMFSDREPSSARLALFDQRLLLATEPGLDFIRLPIELEELSVPTELVEFVERYGAPILISLGSIMSSNKHRIISRLIGVTRMLSLPTVVILGDGPRRPIKGNNTLILGECPLPAAAQYSKLIVHHGGIGSLQEALAMGRPSLTIPLQFDQFDNARRLVALGLGHTAKLERLNDNALASLIEKALNDTQTAEMCQTWKTQVNQRQNKLIKAQGCSGSASGR